MEHFVLEESVQTIKELLPFGVDVTPQQAAQVYLASLHLLCEVKKDQVFLQGIRYDLRCDDQDIDFMFNSISKLLLFLVKLLFFVIQRIHVIRYKVNALKMMTIFCFQI